MIIKRDQSEIDEQSNLAYENEHIFPGMSYAQGVAAALEWVTGQTDDLPIDPAEVY